MSTVNLRDADYLLPLEVHVALLPALLRAALAHQQREEGRLLMLESMEGVPALTQEQRRNCGVARLQVEHIEFYLAQQSIRVTIAAHGVALPRKKKAKRG